MPNSSFHQLLDRKKQAYISKIPYTIQESKSKKEEDIEQCKLKPQYSQEAPNSEEELSEEEES